MLHAQISELRPGDRVVGDSHRVGTVRRTGKVIEVLGELGHARCRVCWDDGHETLLYPGTEIRIEHAAEEHEEIE